MTLIIGICVVAIILLGIGYTLERNRALLLDQMLDRSLFQTSSSNRRLSEVASTQSELLAAKLSLTASQSALLSSHASLMASISSLLSDDQYQKNDTLQKEITDIQTAYLSVSTAYEKILDYRALGGKTEKMEAQLASVFKDLADRKLQSAKTKTVALLALVEGQHTSLLASFITPTAAPSKTVPKKVIDPSQQHVSTSIGTFTVTAISGDMGSTRVIVDTASDRDCKTDCPVLSLAEYVARNGAYAGINGAYFCPSTYPQCSDKKNSFDTLLMNKHKTYFNSENNVYSTVPAVIFGNGFMRFVSRSLEWGRDTSIDSMIANQPLLVSGGTVVFSGDGDPKKGSKGPRSFVGNKGNTAYIGVVFNATVAEAAIVLKAMGLENALNLDSGGSTALWSGGYKVGPGRNLPNAILFVRK